MDRWQVLTRTFNNLTAASAAKMLNLSPHHWFGPALPSLTLILATDDATGKPLYGLFAPQETLNACFEVLYQAWFDNPIHAFYPHLGKIPIQPISPKNSPQSEEHL